MLRHSDSRAYALDHCTARCPSWVVRRCSSDGFWAILGHWFGSWSVGKVLRIVKFAAHLALLLFPSLSLEWPFLSLEDKIGESLGLCFGWNRQRKLHVGSRRPHCVQPRSLGVYTGFKVWGSCFCYALCLDQVVGELVKGRIEVFLGPLAKYHDITIP